MLFTINEQAFPSTPTIVVHEGQLVKLRLTNPTDIPHPMHLHGHRFRVLSHNGQPLTGSPIYLDTISVEQGDTYEIAFVADNPGLWMLHCHIGRHADSGMDMMISYADISTPYTIGSQSGNLPE